MSFAKHDLYCSMISSGVPINDLNRYSFIFDSEISWFCTSLFAATFHFLNGTLPFGTGILAENLGNFLSKLSIKTWFWTFAVTLGSLLTFCSVEDSEEYSPTSLVNSPDSRCRVSLLFLLLSLANLYLHTLLYTLGQGLVVYM